MLISQDSGESAMVNFVNLTGPRSSRKQSSVGVCEGVSREV